MRRSEPFSVVSRGVCLLGRRYADVSTNLVDLRAESVKVDKARNSQHSTSRPVHVAMRCMHWEMHEQKGGEAKTLASQALSCRPGGMTERKSYRTDVSDEEWNFAAAYLSLMNEDAPQRRYELREMFNALRWTSRAGASWRMLPTNFPAWELVYQQMQRWLNADALRRWCTICVGNSGCTGLAGTAQCSHSGWAHAAVDMRKRPTRGL